MNSIGIPPSIFEKYQVIFAYLFGSKAQGNSSFLSDIDIAVFIKQKKGATYFDTKLALYAELCRFLKRNDVDVVILNTTFNIILLDEIVNKGKVLFDKETDYRIEFEQKILHQAIDFKQQRIAVIGK